MIISCHLPNLGIHFLRKFRPKQYRELKPTAENEHPNISSKNTVRENTKVSIQYSVSTFCT